MDGGGRGKSSGQPKFSGGAFYTTSGSVPPATNSRLSPLPPEPADFYDRNASIDIPLDSVADLKKKEKELQSKENELRRREQPGGFFLPSSSHCLDVMEKLVGNILF